jgi:thioredoxin 1
MYRTYDELGSEEVQTPQQAPLSPVHELSTLEEKRQLIGSTALVVVDIYADWCGPCKQTAPAYAVLADRYNSQSKCVLVKENLDRKITQVGSVPIFEFYLYGNKVDQVIGGDIPQVEKKIVALLAETQKKVQHPSSIRSNRTTAQIQNPESQEPSAYQSMQYPSSGKQPFSPYSTFN